MQLYKITDSIHHLMKKLQAIHDPDGLLAGRDQEDEEEESKEEQETEEDLRLQLQKLEMDFDLKIANLDKYWAQLEGQIVMCKNEANRLRKKVGIAVAQIEWLRGYAADEFQRRKINSAGVDGHRLVLPKSLPSVEVLDISVVAIERPEFMNPQPSKVNKIAVKAHFKQTGEVVAGTEIKFNSRVRRG